MYSEVHRSYLESPLTRVKACFCLLVLEGTNEGLGCGHRCSPCLEASCEELGSSAPS